jgi:hypothetical protein
VIRSIGYFIGAPRVMYVLRDLQKILHGRYIHMMDINFLNFWIFLCGKFLYRTSCTERPAPTCF